MSDFSERRREQRLRYQWPVWFAEDFNSTLTQGQMVDVSSGGAAFMCYADSSPYQGQEVTARFSVPRLNEDDSFDMASYTRIGRICRVENVDGLSRRVAIQFAEPLFFKPGEQGLSQDEVQRRLESENCV